MLRRISSREWQQMTQCVIDSNMSVGRVIIAAAQSGGQEVVAELQKKVATSFICQESIAASSINLQHLKQSTDRVVVHLRDPRDITLACAQQILAGALPAPAVAHGYCSWDLQQQLDWQIENMLPNIVDWMSDWAEFHYQESHRVNGFKVLFTTYEGAQNNPQAFYDEVLGFYEISSSPSKQFYKQTTSLNRFTAGSTTNWQYNFTHQQQQRISEIVPNTLLTRFGWELPAVAPRPLLLSYSSLQARSPVEQVLLDSNEIVLVPKM